MRPLVLTLVAAAALSSACGGSSSADAPKTLPPVSASPSPAAAATPTPTGKEAPTPQGAAEFARFFYAQITEAFATKNPDLLTAISLPTCATCQRYIASIADLRANKERATGTTFDIKFAQAPALEGDTARVSIIYDAPDAVRYSASGKVIRREPAVHGVQEQVVLRRSGSSWRVAEVKV